MRNINEFMRAYIECALWSTNDESNDKGGEPLDDNYGPEDISSATLDRIVADCTTFQQENHIDIGFNLSQAGHDFWLTRNGHGAGFWDGDWSEPAATRLTKASKRFGVFDLCVGDDGNIHH